MKKVGKAQSAFVILLSLFASTAARGVIKVEADNTLPVLSVTPSYYVLENVSELFSLNLTITNVTDLYGWEVKIYFPKALLGCLAATEGPFLKSVDNTFWVSPTIDNAYNDTHGRTLIACSLLRMVAGANGSGTLATISFQAKGGGNATLHLADTKLADSHTPTHNPIAHTTTDGVVNVATFHDIVVTDVHPLKTVIGQGFSGNISVTVENRGTNSEVFSVAVFGNDTFIANQTVSLENGTLKTLIFLWNTPGWPYGNWTIKAVADTVLGETLTDNNSLKDGTAVTTIPGDIDGNYKVQLADLVFLAKAYGFRPGEQKWNPNADIDNNGVVGLSDLVVLAQDYGQQYP